jgi:ATP-dependent Lon protease
VAKATCTINAKAKYALNSVIGVNDFETVDNTTVDENGLIQIPILPLRGAVVYPRLVTPITVRDPLARTVANIAIDQRQTVLGIAVRDAATENLSADALFTLGTELAIGRVMSLPEGFESALVQGRRRLQVVEIVQTEPYIIARAREIKETTANPDQLETLEQTVANMFQQSVELNENISDEIVNYALTLGDPGWLADFVASTLTISLEDRQKALEMTELNERLRFVATLLGREINMLELKDEITGQIQQEMSQAQREMYLREQMRVIQGELGEDDIFLREIEEIRQQIAIVGLTAEAREKATQELVKLQMMTPMAPEFGMVRAYLDWILSLPWTKASKDNLDLVRAQKILDNEHYGLPKVKDRILEHIAVRKLAADKMKTPILCFVGPPGVGKTSMGKSIASALGREFARVSLGGVRDEAEIRGHRRTYIGAMPGRIIQTMRRVGTVNPVFMLDEIDKLGADFRGDPAAALLESLDPEQNKKFSDHYLDLDYDLSKVMFITTANDLYPLPPALLDRLEIIEFPGYTEEDKLDIARQFLIPQQLEGHGLGKSRIRFEIGALQTIIREYTYEAGVRNLNREIGTVCRKLARLTAEGKRYPKHIKSDHIDTFLGPPQFLQLRANDEDSVGLATGLAWTSGGGDILTIEVSLLPGKGSLMMTGQLGEVMQESAQAALSYMRSRAKELDVPNDDFENYDVHVHLPEGAIPKDGPSAGITLAAAIISAFTERKVSSDYAMTGEITLRGRVLPVGGIKEKLLAARRALIKNIIMPEQNRKDLVDIPALALRDMNITFVNNMQEVIDKVLLPSPAAGRQRDQDREAEADAAEDNADEMDA